MKQSDNLYKMKAKQDTEFTRFVKKTVKFAICTILLIALLIAAVLFCIAPQYSQGYNASIIDKTERLKELHESDRPKIILIGDSNLSFGIDSSLLEETFDMPVVNMGLHGGLGQEFQMNMAYDYIDANDIVIVSFTSYSGNGIGDFELAWITLENHFDLWHLIPKKNYREMFKEFPNYSVRAIKLFISNQGNQESDDGYSRGSFNQFGDVSYVRESGEKELIGQIHTQTPVITQAGAQLLNQMNQYCKARSATMVVVSYPIMEDEYTPSKEFYIDFRQRMQEAVEAPIISDFNSYRYSPSLFYNTAYHLTSDGARVRTNQLISDLKQFLSNDQ